MHYPPGVVDVMEPFILLVHQGMVEQVFLDDLHARGVDVVRSTQFTRYTLTKLGVQIECSDLTTGESKSLASRFVVGCDGAHSRVRKSMIGAEFDGEIGASLWGVLDGKLKSASKRS
jgi:2-polyprenyl-6-methoxyphenol hydroxylase-like FAD-dependent oxidoreductase